MTITEFNKPVLRIVTDEAMKALESVAAKYGLTIEKTSGTYTDTDFNFKAVFKTPAAKQKEAKTSSVYAEMFGLPKDIIDKEFLVGGKLYVVSDIKPNRRQYPISAKRKSDGKGFKFPVDTVKRTLVQR